MKNIYFLGKPTSAKGIEDFNYISKKIPEAKFHWFTFRAPKNLERKYKNITFIQGLEDAVLKKMIKNKMDIFISCSHFEGFCLPIAEAMLLKKPVISYDLEEVVNEFSDTILYVEQFDRMKFIEKLKEVLHSKESIKNLDHAKEHVEKNFSPSVVTEKLLSFLPL